MGVPGIGKSRLVYELFRVVETAKFGLVNWRHGRCLPYGEGVSFWALGEIVKAQAGILESDPRSEVERKLDEAAGDPWVASHLRPLVGLEAETDGRGDRRVEAFAAWRRFLEDLAGERTLVLVVEDLHWADDDLLDFLDHLVDRAADVELLAVCTARPELLERRSTWGGGKANAVTISLSPLSDDDTARLIGELLEQPLLAADAQADLLARAGGNPLYAEQFTRMLSERVTGADLRLPETVQGIVAARLDLLEPEQKSLLQAAAVLGRTFWAGGVAAMEGQDRFTVEERLHPLERKDFVRREHRSTVADDSQYTFLHVLVRDVAYGQIPRAERADKHRRAAEWIESLGRQEAHADLLAHHYLSALELAAAAGRALQELAPKAVRALGEAGDRALALNAFSAAARFYRDALGLTPTGDAGRPGLLLRCSRALQPLATGDEVVGEAVEALLATGDEEGAAEAELILAELAWFRADRESSATHLLRAHSLIEHAPPSAAKARVLAEKARYAALDGDSQLAVTIGNEAIALAESLGLEAVRARTLMYVGQSEVELGDDEGVHKLEESIEILVGLNSSEMGRAYNNLGVLQVSLGALSEAIETHRRGLAAVAQFGDYILARWLRSQLEVPWAFVLGDWDAVVGSVEQGLAGGVDYLDMNRHDCRGRIRLARGDRAGAVSDAEGSLRIGRTGRDPQLLVPSLSFGATAFLAGGRRREAEELVDELLAHDSLRYPIAHHSAPWIDLSWALVELGRTEDLLAAIGRVERRTIRVEAAEAIARGDYSGAAATYARMGHLPAEAYARLRAAHAGQPRSQLERAIAFFRKAGATAYLAEAEQLIAASA
jgi:tetratricopeptide (TPR) repeat protein